MSRGAYFNINHILRFDEGIHISDVLIIRRGSKLSGFNHFHLHEHFNILGHFGLTEQWRSVTVSSSEILTSLIGTFNYMDFTIKTQVGCNYLCQPIDSPEESLDALTR